VVTSELVLGNLPVTTTELNVNQAVLNRAQNSASKTRQIDGIFDQTNPTFFQYPSIWSLSFRKFKNLSLLQFSLLMLRYSGRIRNKPVFLLLGFIEPPFDK